jgi:hypothetical protein
MKTRDRRFRTGRTYTVHGVKWVRSSNFAKRTLTWKTTRSLHPVRIERDKFGRYYVSCDSHGHFASTLRLDRAFRSAAVHMGYEVMALQSVRDSFKG